MIAQCAWQNKILMFFFCKHGKINNCQGKIYEILGTNYQYERKNMARPCDVFLIIKIKINSNIPPQKKHICTI